MAQHYSIKDVCHVLRVPRSAYYAWLNRRPSQRAADNQQLREKLATLFVANRSVYGSPRLRVCLQKEGIPCSRNRVARHMRAMHLKARQKRAFKPKTTDANHPHPIAPNRLREVGRPKSQPGLGRRHHLYLHRPRLALPGSRHGPLQPEDHRMGHQRLIGNTLGESSPAAGID